MNFKESKKILNKIKKSEMILLNCHKGVDPDSAGSALALYEVLKGMGKDVTIICPTPVQSDLKFLEGYKQITTVNFEDFDFSRYDILIAQDSGSWDMVSGNSTVPKPSIPIIVIDHHKTNERYGSINLVDPGCSSNAQLLYLILQDWKVSINKKVGGYLLTGIIGDTGAFRYPGTTAQTLEIASDLVNKGSDKDEIIERLYFDLDFKILKFYGEVLRVIKFDKKHKFIWSAIDFETFKDYGDIVEAKSMAAAAFAQSVKGANFGLIMVEVTKKRLLISLRSKKGFDISALAKDLGGGGHESAAGGKIEGLKFSRAVKKVLTTAREFAKKNA